MDRAKFQHTQRTLQPTSLSSISSGWRNCSGLHSWFERVSAPHFRKFPNLVENVAEDHANLRSNQESAESRARRLEGVLFLSREPISSRKLSQLADLEDGTEARALIRRLNQNYLRTGRAFKIEAVAGGFLMLTRPQFAGWLRRLEDRPSELKLTAPALETLAVIAYRQPLLRAEVEAIRGVACGELLRQLMDRNLVKIAGRSQDLGRPFLYATTRLFLTIFGLNSLEDLPRAKLLRRKTKNNDNMAEEDSADSVPSTQEDADVSVTTFSSIPNELEEARKLKVGFQSGQTAINGDDDDYEEEEYEDEEEDDFEDEDEEEDLEEEDLEEEEWEEVDADEELDEEDLEDEEWDDEDEEEDEEWDEEEDEDLEEEEEEEFDDEDDDDDADEEEEEEDEDW